MRPGSEVASTTPGAATSGFTRASKARPRDENGAISAAEPLRAVLGTPIETIAWPCLASWSAAILPTRVGTLSTGTSTASSSPSPPAGSSVP